MYPEEYAWIAIFIIAIAGVLGAFTGLSFAAALIYTWNFIGSVLESVRSLSPHVIEAITFGSMLAFSLISLKLCIKGLYR